MKTRLSESHAEAKESTNHNARFQISWLFGSSALLLTSYFSLDYKWRSRKWNRKKMETIWFFWLWFRRTYVSHFWFHSFKSALKTPTTTLSLAKTSVSFGAFYILKRPWYMYVPSRWLDVGQVLSLRVHKLAKKERGQHQPSWPYKLGQQRRYYMAFG